jgi:P4 family phage/plasmid primase-like protien
VLTAACGLAAGYDPEEVGGHFCGEWSPYDGDTDLSDKETTEYQVRHINDGGYAPPSEQTLRDYGILDEGEHCDEDCPVDYHGPRQSDTPDLAVVSDRPASDEATAVAGPEEQAADGGVTGAQSVEAVDRGRGFNEEVRDAIREFNDDVIQAKTARHYIARAFVENYHFVHPEPMVEGWRSVLYVFDPEAGIYEPRGDEFIESRLEAVAGDFVTNQVRNEIVEKVKRQTVTNEELSPPAEELVVGNGILNLHTGELSAYTPKKYHRTKIDIDWRPDAGEPEAIDEFLHDIVDDTDVTTLYRLISHTLYKEYLGEKAAILIGSGENGKSMFLDLVEEFLGGWNVAHRELQDFSGDMYAANNLQGKLANLATEIGEQEVEDTTAFKKLTGRDMIDAPVKFEKPVTFENFATLMFATNEMPVFGQDNHAIWRRWVYIDFPYTFDDDDPHAKDPEPERVIKARTHDEHEFEALLVRCQEEIQRWYEGEPFFADAMEPDEVRDKMRKAAEPVFAFATTCLEGTNDDSDYIKKSVVRSAYQAFADEEDLPRIAPNEFGQRLLALRDLGIEVGQKRVDGSRSRVYKRLQLSSRGRQVLGIDEPDGDQEAVNEMESNKPKVLDELRDMVESRGGDPVPREGVVWRCTGQMSKQAAEHALEELAKSGDVVEMDGGVLPT